jgi:rod shape-determining protein MreC
MKNKRIATFFIIILLVIAAILADNYFKFGASKKIADYSSPVGVVFTNIGEHVSGFVINLGDISNLSRENKNLNEKLNNALAEIARLSEAQKENELLKNDLKFKKENNYELVPARIIFFDPTNIRETITINAGSRDGIKIGDAVLSQGFLVGRIESMTENTSKILMISDPDSAVPVNVVNSSVTGIVKGKIGADLILDQVPQSEKVSVGDLLATSGLGGQYPKGLLVGKIENIKTSTGSIFQAIAVRPMIELTKLERVMIIIND